MFSSDSVDYHSEMCHTTRYFTLTLLLLEPHLYNPCVVFRVKLTTGQQVCLEAAVMAQGQVIVQTAESQRFACSPLFRRTWAGCWGRSLSLQSWWRETEREKKCIWASGSPGGTLGLQLGLTLKCRWKKQNKTHLPDSKVFIFFSNVDTSPVSFCSFFFSAVYL